MASYRTFDMLKVYDYFLVWVKQGEAKGVRESLSQNPPYNSYSNKMIKWCYLRKLPMI